MKTRLILSVTIFSFLLTLIAVGVAPAQSNYYDQLKQLRSEFLRLKDSVKSVCCSSYDCDQNQVKPSDPLPQNPGAGIVRGNNVCANSTIVNPVFGRKPQCKDCQTLNPNDPTKIEMGIYRITDGTKEEVNGDLAIVQKLDSISKVVTDIIADIQSQKTAKTRNLISIQNHDDFAVKYSEETDAIASLDNVGSQFDDLNGDITGFCDLVQTAVIGIIKP